MPRLIILLLLAAPAYGQRLTPARTLSAGDGFPLASALSPDGKTLACLHHNDRTVRLWDPATGKSRRDLVLTSAVRSLAIGPDGKTLAVASGPVIHLFDLATGTEAGRLTGHGASVKAVAYFPDGTRLVSAAGDGQVRLWDLGRRRATRALQVSDNPPHAVAVSPDGSAFAVSTEECAYLYDAATGFRRLQLRPPEDAGAHALAFSPDGRTLAVGHWSGQVHLYELFTGKTRAVLATGGLLAECAAFSADGRTVACGGDRGYKVRLWDLPSDTARPAGRDSGGTLTGVHWGQGDRTLLVASRGTSTGVYEAEIKKDRPAFTALKPADAWEALDGPDGPKAYRAMWSLALMPDGVALLVREMKHVSAQIKAYRDKVARLIAQLDADEYDDREKASAVLAAMGPDVYDELEQALKSKPPLEQHRRIERLLRGMERPANPLPLGLLRRLRAVEALEYAATPEARATVERLTTAEDDRLKASARASLARMKK